MTSRQKLNRKSLVELNKLIVSHTTGTLSIPRKGEDVIYLIQNNELIVVDYFKIGGKYKIKNTGMIKHKKDNCKN